MLITFSLKGIHWTYNGRTIHTLPDDPNLIGIETNSSEQAIAGIHFDDEFSDIGLGITTKLIIEDFGSDFEGNYSCENGVQSDDVKNTVMLLQQKPAFDNLPIFMHVRN